MIACVSACMLKYRHSKVHIWWVHHRQMPQPGSGCMHKCMHAYSNTGAFKYTCMFRYRHLKVHIWWVHYRQKPQPGSGCMHKCTHVQIQVLLSTRACLGTGISKYTYGGCITGRCRNLGVAACISACMFKYRRSKIHMHA